MPEQTRRPSPRAISWIVPILAALLVVGTVGLVHTGAREQAGDDATAGVLVVSANLQDTIRPADAADMRDLDTFVSRLSASTPQAPDVLLLTEVLGPGARRIASRRRFVLLGRRDHRELRPAAPLPWPRKAATPARKSAAATAGPTARRGGCQVPAVTAALAARTAAGG